MAELINKLDKMGEYPETVYRIAGGFMFILSSRQITIYTNRISEFRFYSTDEEWYQAYSAKFGSLRAEQIINLEGY